MKRIDCDVFMKDGTTLDFGDQIIFITGNFYGGNNCRVTSIISAGEDVVFGDYTNADGICACGNVSIGKFSTTSSIESDKSIFLDHYTTVHDVFAKKDVSLGYKANAWHIYANGDISADEHCKPTIFFKKLLQDIKFFLFGE